MALTRLYQFDTGTTLAEADIEGEFDQIYGSSLSLVSPWTGNMAAGGNLLTGLSLGSVSGPSLQFTGDTNTGIYSSAADTVDIATGGVRAASFGATNLVAASPEDARTATVDQAFEIRSTTSGVPAAGIGVGLLFSAESADENPSEFGRLDFAASDIGAATEDTYLSVLLRVAGGALDEKYRFSSTAGSGFAALFTHAVTADRTYTLPDTSGTLGFGGLTWVGGNTTEGTTTNVEASLATVSSLSIATTSPILIVAAVAKGSGAAANGSFALQLNGVTLNAVRASFDATNEVQDGVVEWLLPARQAGGTFTYAGGVQRHATGGAVGESAGSYHVNGRPNAAITDVVIRGVSGSASTTVGVQGINVYTLAIS